MIISFLISILRLRSGLHQLLILILSAFGLALSAQSDTSWYRHYVMDSLETMFPSGMEPCGTDAVVIIGATAYFNDPPDNRTALLRIDGSNGDILWQTRLTHNPVAESSHIFFFIRGFIRLRDSSYIVLVETFTENGDVGFALHRIGPDGSVIWHTDYGISGQDILPNGGLGIGPDSMSFVLSARRLDTPNQSSRLLLYHIDAEGEVMNYLDLYTGLQFYSLPSPIAMLADSSFVVGLNLSNLDFDGPKWLRHISYNGQTLRTIIAWDRGWWSDLRRHPTGQLVAVSQTFSGDWENREKHGMRTTMYTPDLDTVWSRVYNQFEGPFYYREIDFPGGASFDTQGNILVDGDGSAYNGVRPAHLIMYNVDGEVLWIKRLGIGDDVAGYVQNIGGIIAFQPNGIFLAGDIGVNEMLLIRLDSAGCVVEDDCGIDYLLNTDDEPQEIVFDFRLTPNPAVDEVMVSVSDDHFQILKNPKTHILDLTGRILASFALSGPRQNLDISHLPQGVFVVMLESRNSTIRVQKLVKY